MRNPQPLIRNLTATLSAAALLSSCGVESGGLRGAIDAYTVNSGDFEFETRSQLRGSGTVVMSEVLPDGLSANSYQVEINLLNDGSSVTLVAHSPNTSLATGLKLRFTRVGANLTDAVVIDGAGNEVNTDSDIENLIRPDKIQMVIDVHNDSATPRILAWPDSVQTFDSHASYLDTNQINHLPVGAPALQQSAATGVFWGLIINDAEITFAQLGEAKLE